MKVPQPKARKGALFLFPAKVAIAFVGLTLSIVLHEAFHVAVHWDAIQSITLLPNPMVLVEITSTAHATDNLILEEAVAYSITILVLLLTIMAISKVHDSKDARGFKEIALPKHSSLHELDIAELIEIAYRTELFPRR